MIALLFSIPAWAQELPKFDPAKHCKTVSEFAGQGSSNMIYNGCIDMEQRAYNGLKDSWENVDTKTRSHCISIAQVGGSSYSTLKGCVDMESKAGSDKSEFEF
ncbi:hypothetical protein [Bartonella tamiae]|uniref:Uncharacterized protein n=1 Tax=Bartonella tamiae Th239 TaxID=1094558 RepID=J0ZLY6_9HYPH|nr:hypothetical protein [Bartonella tamiae]EJF89418.1 hypothetical protein ME5_01969 [Bartonella tamiae Th239]EJF92717.1 hypothetical protein MEG_01887 [Bartonella tamiae Th307]